MKLKKFRDIYRNSEKLIKIRAVKIIITLDFFGKQMFSSRRNRRYDITNKKLQF